MTGWNDWNRIAEYLKVMANNARYARYVQALLELIPQLQQQPDFEDVEPGLLHLTLTLGIRDGKRKIHVDWERAGFYNVYLDHAAYNIFGSGDFYGDRVVVPADEVIPTLQRYLVRLRLESIEGGQE